MDGNSKPAKEVEEGQFVLGSNALHLTKYIEENPDDQT